MLTMRLPSALTLLSITGVVLSSLSYSQDPPQETRQAVISVSVATIEGTGQGWRELGAEDFTNVNCKENTWKWDGNNVTCDGDPVGVIRTKKQHKNFELVCEWKHLRYAGNSGIFAWVDQKSIDELVAGKGRLPSGIEVQILDLGFATNWEKKKGKPADWFTCHGDIFPTGSSKMTPFLPAAPNGKRSFPTKNLTKGLGEWNHYYIRAINGEIRLWVNGEEVSGGTACSPANGFICLESEGAPIEFRNLRLRELP